MAESRTKPTPIKPDDFIAAVPDAARRADAKALVPIFRRATGERPAMWGPSIVGFGKYHYRYASGREGDMCLEGFSPRSTALVLYVLSGAKGEDELLARLGKVKRGKSCLYVARLDDVDREVLEDLVRLSTAHTRATQQCGICVESRATTKAARSTKTGTTRRPVAKRVRPPTTAR